MRERRLKPNDPSTMAETNKSLLVSSQHLILSAVLVILIVVSLLRCPFNENRTFVGLSNSYPLSPTNYSKTEQVIHTKSTSLPQVSGNEIISPSAYKSGVDKPRYIKKKASLDRIEGDLAEARAAIRRAIRLRNYTSDKEETFVPRGSVYRNAYAFHQSHVEMVKRFKVWTYKEGDYPLVHSAPMGNIYGVEGQFMAEMEDENNSFRATHPDKAHAFYLPLSVANVIQYVYIPITSPQDYSRDRLQGIANDYIVVVSDRYPYWNRSFGADHFMVACHDWGPDISSADHELYKNFIRVICNANISEGFRPKIDVSMAEVFLPIGNLGPPYSDLPLKKRSILAFYAGGAHGYFREQLLEHWKDKDKDVQVHEHLQSRKKYVELLKMSKFCLCPSGYEVATGRLTEAIFAGCVPVIIKKNYSLPFNDVLNWNRFSVYVPHEKIPELKMILHGIPYTKYVKMQKNVIKVRRHFEINRPAKPFDWFHMVLHSVWLRRLDVKLEGFDLIK